ncbi:helix-turn-helix domain-containing protein [Micromonospora echinofusca]|uniref:helix-turn-helix domain-containing protein n=1 Tax=Micromonospora echinofusca TaxID=47858 RepID=UPI0027DD984A|nr:helix-turn-helix transcriptional regulator [Micromonospora echinofusca]
MSLLRRVIGGVLRRVRLRQGRTLRDVAEAAGVSVPYLSEIERGRKEASSEVLAAICRALGMYLSDLLEEARDDLRRMEPRIPAAPRVPAVPGTPVPRSRVHRQPRCAVRAFPCRTRTHRKRPGRDAFEGVPAGVGFTSGSTTGQPTRSLGGGLTAGQWRTDASIMVRLVMTASTSGIPSV